MAGNDVDSESFNLEKIFISSFCVSHHHGFPVIPWDRGSPSLNNHGGGGRDLSLCGAGEVNEREIETHLIYKWSVGYCSYTFIFMENIGRAVGRLTYGGGGDT